MNPRVFSVKIVVTLMLLYIVLDVIFGIEETSNRTIPYMFSLLMQLLTIGILFFELSKTKIRGKYLVVVLLIWIGMNLLHTAIAFLTNQNLVENFTTFLKFNYWAIAAVTFFLLGANLRNTDRAEVFKYIYKISVITVVFVSLRNLYIYLFIPDRTLGLKTELINRNPYILLWVTPTLFFLRKNKYNFILIALALVAILVSAKRGPFVAVVFGLSMLAFIGDHKIKLGTIIRYSVFLVLLGTFASFFLTEQVAYFSERWVVDDVENSDDALTSGRTLFWTILYEKWINGNAFDLLFGFGINSAAGTLFSTIGFNIFAHSDWVEIMFDYGLTGITIFLAFHICMVRMILKAKKHKFKYTNILILVYSMYFISNFFTQSIVGIHQAWIFLSVMFLFGISHSQANALRIQAAIRKKRKKEMSLANG